jgi:hypothetical protein
MTTTLMMNPERLRASLRRLFSNEWHEIVGALLQNAQRAGATEIAVTTTTTGFCVSDNGHGLQHGVASFATLLSLGDSDFENPAVIDQQPMGLGVHALLAAEGVSEVRFSSGDLTITLDTARWWADPVYVKHWHDQLLTLEIAQPGLVIGVTCTPKVSTALVDALTRTSSYLADRTAPHEGYADLLQITLDGQALHTATPAWVMPQPILTTTYQGCALTIGTSSSSTRAWGAINWFVQIILHHSRIPFYVHVRAGRPVNPLAPSRRGLIQDAALAALERHVADALFTMLATTSPAQLDPAWIRLAWAAYPERARQLPVCVVARLRPVRPDGAIESADVLNATDDPVVVARDTLPLLLDEVVQIATTHLDRAPRSAGAWRPPTQEHAGTTWESAEYGRDAFVALLAATGQVPYALIHGDATQLPIRTIWWQPGPQRADVFNERGQWGLGTAEEPPSAWHDVTTDVWACASTSDTDATDVDWAVGTDDPLRFLATLVWAGFQPYDDNYLSHDEQETLYRDSVSAWKRRLIGACVSWRFTLAEVRDQLPTPTARLHQITYLYDDETAVPVAILAENAAGEQRTLRIVD